MHQMLFPPFCRFIKVIDKIKLFFIFILMTTNILCKKEYLNHLFFTRKAKKISNLGKITWNAGFDYFLAMYVFKLQNSLFVCLLQINVVHSLHRMSLRWGNDKRSYPIFKSFSEAMFYLFYEKQDWKRCCRIRFLSSSLHVVTLIKGIKFFANAIWWS